MNIGPSWTEDRVADLRRMRGEGLSGSEIGAVLGVSRCAAIAKACRLGIPSTSYDQKRQLGVRRPRKQRKQYMAKRIDIFALERIDLPPDTSFACTIDGLTEETCRFPLGEPAYDMRYCGAKRVSGFSYCIAHARLAYKPLGRRG